MQRIVIVGCGYVGSRFAKVCLQSGQHVTVISRDIAKVAGLAIADRLIQYDWSDSNVNWQTEEPVNLLLCAVSHRVQSNAAGENSNVHARCLANIISGFTSVPKRIIYVSTTGVYQSGDGGDWTDETAACQPERPGAQNAYDAERWLGEKFPRQSVILRPAGIYGPDRIPNLEALRSGEPIAANPQSYLNLIHVDDLVQVIGHVATAPSVLHHIYNVADGTPVLREEYYSYLTKQLGAATPVYTMNSSGIRARGQGSKRIDASRLSNDFSIVWLYPNYKIGLAPLLAARTSVPND